MWKRLFLAPLGAAVALVLGGCDDEPRKTVPTAPDLAVAADGAVQPAGGALFRFRSKGAFGDVSFFGGNRFGFASVSRGGPANDPQTSLFYTVLECGEFFCTEIEAGFGAIPNTDLKVDGNARGLRLNTNTSTATNPDFVRFAGSGGVVAISWERISASSSRVVTNGQTRFANLLFRSHTNATFFSASAQGSIVGTAVGPDNAFATIGTSHEGTLAVERGQ